MNQQIFYTEEDILPYLSHSYKGSTWKKHKYIKKRDGQYIYPKGYQPSLKNKGHITRIAENSARYISDRPSGALSKVAKIGEYRVSSKKRGNLYKAEDYAVNKIKERESRDFKTKAAKRDGKKVIRDVLKRIGSNTIVSYKGKTATGKKKIGKITAIGR